MLSLDRILFESVNLSEYSATELRQVLDLDIPHSSRTLLRAQLFLTFSKLCPTTRLHMHHLGFGKKTVSNVFREFIKDGLIVEKGILYDISEKGILLTKHLMNNPIVANWFNSVYMFQKIEMPKRNCDL